MTDDLTQVASALVECARRGEAVEAFLVHERTFQVKTFMGEVESISSAEPRGAGVRVFDGGRAGFAYTTDMDSDGLDDVVERARESARFATPDEAVDVAPPWTEPPVDIEGLIDPDQSRVSAADKVAFAVDLERTTRAADPKIRTVEEAMYADSESTLAIATSSGVSGAYTSTDAWCYSFAIAAEGEDTQVGFEFDLGRGLADLDAHGVAMRAAERAVGVLGARKISSARIPVVFDAYVAGQFLGVLARALTGESVQKGRSLFAGKLGESVASSSLSMIDDGRVPGAPGSAPWDAEGTPTQRTDVITEGVLRSYLYDLTSARREGRGSTGNATRAGFKSGPGPAPSNLAFEPFGGTAAEVMRSAGRALLVQDFHGVHSGANSVSGDFSVGATGRLLENGVPGAPVKEVTIAAPMLEILKGISAVADDRRWLPFGGSFGGATTLVAEMTVAGE